MNAAASVEYSTVILTLAECTAIKEENMPAEDPLLVIIQPGS